MKKLKNNTGYNPNYNNSVGTANEKDYFETTAIKNNLSAMIKNNKIIVDTVIYPCQEIYVYDKKSE
ncbi:MAG: hypothetical protein PF638_04320 [Candidatus Delongbacteria bacterium]|jgi:hypothetical protein|nr:hypothetical protein [Candidatus Delongbacteria bacterium]